MKALIVYGTRYGATAGTAMEIAKVLREKDIETRIVDVKKEKVKDISEYTLIIVSSGIRIGRWTKEPENFLKKHNEEIRNKKLALFVSSGTWPLYEEGGLYAETKEDIKASDLGPTKEEAYEKYLVAKTQKYSLQPISMGLFGGLLDFTRMGRITGKLFAGLRKDLETHGIDTSKPYDNRDWDAIRQWAIELAEKAQH